MSTEEQKDNEQREGGELEATTAASVTRRASESADGDDEGTAESAPADAAAAEEADDSDDESAADESDGAGPDDATARDDAPAAATAPASADASAAKKAAARASAGARLAAAKAAKAAKKAAKKAQLAADSADADSLVGTGGGMPAKDASEVLKESPIGQAASKAGEWASANRTLAAVIVGVLVVGALGWVGYGWWSSSQAEAAGALLQDALEIANAEIVSADAAAAGSDEDEDEQDDAPTFATREARAQASLEAYRRVLTQYPGAEAARWARLGEAKALFDLGQNEEAREVYERAVREAGGDPVVAWRAMEGIAFTYEVDEQWDQAIEQYQELRSIEDGAYEAPADYHIARMRIAKGERVEATTALRALVERLRPEEAGQEPAFPYVLAQAEVRLRELDPGAASGSGSPMMIGPGGPGGGGGGGLPPGLEGIDPQILEQLRRQLGAAGGGAGEGAPE